MNVVYDRNIRQKICVDIGHELYHAVVYPHNADISNKFRYGKDISLAFDREIYAVMHAIEFELCGQ